MKPRSIRCMKFFLTLINIICIIFGLALTTVCVINLRQRDRSPDHQAALSRGVLSFLLTVGLGIVGAALLGCIGALREHGKTLYVHACFFVFLVSVEVVVGVGGALLSAWVGGGSQHQVQSPLTSPGIPARRREMYSYSARPRDPFVDFICWSIAIGIILLVNI